MLVYVDIDESLEAMGDATKILEEDVPLSPENPCETIEAITTISERAASYTSLPTE